MIEITLKELNDSYESLKKVAESIVGAKMSYRFARTLKSAHDHVEFLSVELSKIAQRHDATMIGASRFSFDEVKQRQQLIAFNKEADELMASEKVEIWGDPEFYNFDDIQKAAKADQPISAASLSRLFWLISESKEEAA